MTEKTAIPIGIPKSDAEDLGQAEVLRFYSEVGRDVAELDRMLRMPTEERPFVYELRCDLWPPGNKAGLCVAKGFGAEGGLIAFQEGIGLLAQLRGLKARLRSGKLRFSVDKFPPGNYEERVKGWLGEQQYLEEKLGSR